MSQRTVGVLGTLVWDRIFTYGEGSASVEDWGGVAYALAAFPVVLPEEWTILPIVKVGEDVSEEAHRFLSEIPGADLSGIRFVEEDNNRIELRYVTPASRTETLTGGVPGWTWEELEPIVAKCDALYVNFISGAEVDPATGPLLRAAFEGPIYADLHSLFLEPDESGRLRPCSLGDWAGHLACFDAIQMNQVEFELLGDGQEPWIRAGRALGTELKLVTVTLGEEGAAFAVSEDLSVGPARWSATERFPSNERRKPRTVKVPGQAAVGDPTGCGDVFGATTFSRLLAGDLVERAVQEGNRIGALNVEFQGAGGLRAHLSARARGGVRETAGSQP